jgi:WD40 repeat protein
LFYDCVQVKEFPAHSATVNEVSFDSMNEYVASCSDDGSVVINSLYSDERERFEYHRPMKAVALDPEYSQKSSKRFVAGGLAGNLFLHTKGWLGREKHVGHRLNFDHYMVF